MASENHWDSVYASKGDQETSWYEPSPRESLEMLDLLGVRPTDAVIDVGGGTSRLTDELVARGHGDLAVLDVSAQALERTRARLGAAGEGVELVAADITTWRPARQYDVWHDRAVFHFLTDPEDREGYRTAMRQALRPGGAFVVATFAEDGPTVCSGLTVARYSAEDLADALGPDLDVVQHQRLVHTTPWGAKQSFTWIAGRLRGPS